MDFDIELFLLIASALTGFIWLFDAQYLSKKRALSIDTQNEPVIVDYARSLFPVFFIVLVVRSFLFEPFRIPSQSMMPTLWIGDFILVNKFSYGVRLPVFDLEILNTGRPERGDVAVFRFPNDTDINYIKRVVGVPGDKISYSANKILTVNGKRVEESSLGGYSGMGSGENMNNAWYKRENLVGIEHNILQVPGRYDMFSMYHPSVSKQHRIDFTVPKGMYYVMGDNRDNSNDSRYWGLVSENHLVGKAVLIWFNWDTGYGFFWNRMGTEIK